MPTFDTPLNSVAATGEHLVRLADATPARAGALPNGTASNQPDTRSSPTDGFPLSCGRRDGWTSMSRTWRGPPGPRTQFVRERIAEGDWERRAYIYDWRPLECCVDNGVHNMAAVTGCRGLKKSVSSGRQGHSCRAEGWQAHRCSNLGEWREQARQQQAAAEAEWEARELAEDRAFWVPRVRIPTSRVSWGESGGAIYHDPCLSACHVLNKDRKSVEWQDLGPCRTRLVQDRLGDATWRDHDYVGDLLRIERAMFYPGGRHAAYVLCRYGWSAPRFGPK